jgi:UDP-N-acetylmuramate: L-alanyl-gamma-D-glutamyl-meso-diaminopimelate ligase
MHIHFIAIGGAAMHNLAIALQNKGYKVTGSDDEIFEPSRTRLANQGLLPETFGWNPDKITNDIDAIILGMHARKDNPELLEAQKLGLKIYSYPAYVYEQTKNKKRVVIGGSHGKTTITSMVMHVLKKLNYQFDYLAGSMVEGFDTMVNLDQQSDIAVLEGDEYLSSPLDPTPKFHHYHPHIAIITGIAWDHINVFPTIESYNEQFRKFIEMIQPNGKLFYYQNDPVLSELAETTNANIQKRPYGSHPSEVENGQTTLNYKNQKYRVPFFGKHNMENVMAARLVCEQLGVSDDDFYWCISSFRGAGKRLQLVAANNHSLMFIDFAHSPSKLKATIAAVKEQFPEKQLIACMELHTFSSLERSFLNQYKGSMKDADVPLVFYHPETIRHKKLELFEASDVNKAFDDKRIRVFNEPSKLNDFLSSQHYQNTVLLLMSSGHFSGIDMEKLKHKIQS